VRGRGRFVNVDSRAPCPQRGQRFGGVLAPSGAKPPQNIASGCRGHASVGFVDPPIAPFFLGAMLWWGLGTFHKPPQNLAPASRGATLWGASACRGPPKPQKRSREHLGPPSGGPELRALCGASGAARPAKRGPQGPRRNQILHLLCAFRLGAFMLSTFGRKHEGPQKNNTNLDSSSSRRPATIMNDWDVVPEGYNSSFSFAQQFFSFKFF